MSKIEKLSILGVRSFDPVNRETIQFHTPLTLIVGYNGSGKTTIIECLRYATTGELPPNSKGGAFIHDPKLCGEKEVLAQVKLAFRTTAGEHSVVTRNLQLTIKKNTRSQKTLEGSLTWTSVNGERNSSSSRVNDLDTIVPEKLGVSPAILDAVIFTHQDDSLWPMSEPSVLKKRFDEIFEALRYTKAIDNLKVLKKKYTDEHGKLKIHLGHDQEKKTKAEQRQREITQLDNEMGQMRVQIEEISEEMDGIEAKSKEKAEQANASLRYVNDLENKLDKLHFRQGAVKELRETIDEMSESDAFLEDAFAQYEGRLGRLQEEADQSVGQWKQLQQQLNDTREVLGKKQSDQGKHQSDREKFEQQSERRVGMIKEAAQRHGIHGYSGDLDERQVQAFRDRLDRLVQDKRKDLQRVQQENGWEQEKLGSELQALETRKASRAQDRNSSKTQMESIDKNINRKTDNINTLGIDEGSRQVEESRLEELDLQLAKARAETNNADLENDLNQENNRLTQLEAENAKLGQELLDCTRLATERAQLDLRKKELVDRKRELNTRVNTWKEKISDILGTEWTPASVETDFQGVLKGHQRSVEDAHTRRETAQNEMKQVDFKLANARDRRKKTSGEEARGRLAVKKALEDIDQPNPVEDFPAVVDELEEKLAVFDQDIKLFDHLKQFYQKSQSVLNKKGTCSHCDRAFGPDQHEERSKYAAKLQKFIGKETKAEIEQEKAIVHDKLTTLRAARPHFETYQRARVELPPIDKEIKSLGVEKEALLRQLEQHDADYRAVDEKRQEIEAMSKNVGKISQLVKDIAESESQIERSAAQLNLTGPVQSAEEIHDQQKATTEQINVAKDKIKRLESDKRRKQDALTQLVQQQMKLKHKVDTAKQLLSRKNELLEEIQQLKDDYNRHRETIQQADKDMEALEFEISKARTIRNDAVERGRAKETKAADERDALIASVNEFKGVEDNIRRYIESGGPAALEANRESVKTLQQTIANIEKDMTDVTKQVNKMKEEISNSDRQKRNINDNLNYRKNLQALRELEADIAALNERNDKADYDRLIGEKKALDDHYNVLLAKKGTMMGGLNSKDGQLGTYLEEWEREYAGAAQKYRETHIKVETTKAAIEDIRRYSEALDKAVMQFHTLKMGEVNRIAGELWQSTYQGTDIDTILIRSDAESTGARRNYNYRVCMVKQDTEMDMRGRCSAGQKVLASIIIRLALAESFGVSCGLIALDEPTTNLDSDNIRSLAESLHRIIRARQAQSNFQLIVITHDEEFLRHMQCSDFCDTFYRVRRDEKQCSIIRGESITKVME